jgi:hypothetical protein
MAVPLPDGRRGQLLALGITALVLAAVWIGAIAPALAWYSERGEQLRTQHAMARRMAALVATLPTLLHEAEATRNDTGDAAALLTGASDTVAAATLQQRIDELAAAAGVRLASEEILPAQAAGDLRTITVRVTVSGPWKGFVNLLLALGQAEIPMIADEVQLRAPAANQRTPERTPDVLVDGSLTVTSYRAAGDAK